MRSAILPCVSENVDLIRVGFEIFEREGFSAVEALLPLIDPEIEVYTEPRLINAGTYHGHDGYLRWARQWMEAWEDFRMEALEFIEVGDSIVVVPLHQTARGRGSGVPVEMEIAYLLEVRDGKVRRFHLYESKEGALGAAERLATDRP